LVATACGRVVVMQADGSHVRVLARVSQDVHAIDWSPDSRRLAYSTAGARGGIWTITRSGGRPHLVIRKPGVGRVFWSPRGTQIAFLREWDRTGFTRTRSSEVFVVRLSGSGLRRVAIGSAGEPWSPDGRKLVYSSAQTLYTFELATGVRTSLGDGIEPAWAPAGAAIAFSYYREEDFSNFVGVVRTNGTDRRLLTQGFSPVWSPDGARIAYVGYGASLRIMRRDGTGKRTIGPSLYEGEMYQLDWSR
jgi:Tol biopolymer transport system component